MLTVVRTPGTACSPAFPVGLDSSEIDRSGKYLHLTTGGQPGAHSCELRHSSVNLYIDRPTRKTAPKVFPVSRCLCCLRMGKDCIIRNDWLELVRQLARAVRQGGGVLPSLGLHQG